MRLAEIIRVQTGNKVETAEAMLARFAEELEYAEGMERVEIHRNAELSTDFAFLIRWNTEKPLSRGSREALHIKEAMKGIGVVYHSVWIAREREKVSCTGVLIG